MSAGTVGRPLCVNDPLQMPRERVVAKKTVLSDEIKAHRLCDDT